MLIRLSTSLTVQETNHTPAMWQWRDNRTPIEGDSRLIDQLVAEKWQCVSSADKLLLQSMMSTQLYDMVRIHYPDQSTCEIWARTENIERVQQAPVILAFDIPPEIALNREVTMPQRDIIDMLQFLPPPQMGEFAVIPLGDDKSAIYHIRDIHEEGQAIWQKLSNALQALAAPGDWIRFSFLYATVSNLHGLLDYNHQVHETGSRIRTLKGKESQVTKETLATIEATRKCIVDLQQSLETSDWLIQWQNIQHMARDLALAYWELHRRQIEINNAYSPETLPGVIPPITPVAQTKRPRRKHIPPASLVTKDAPAVIIRSDYIALEIARGLLNPDHYTAYPDRLIAEYHQSFAKDKGQIFIIISPGSDENWGHVLKSLNMLADETVDTFFAAMANAIETNGTHNITAPFYISPDDILATCCRAKSKGSYTSAQRLKVIEHLRILSRAHIRVSFPLRKGHDAFAESPILEMLASRYGVINTSTGEEIWEKREIKIGNWATDVPEVSQQTATMLRQVLKYHSQRQRYEKRFGRYLTFMFRVNAARRGGMFQCSMQVLLDQSGIRPDLKHPSDARTAIENALARLQTDKIIGEYGMIIDNTPDGQEAQERIKQRIYHWWDFYSRQQWYFYPPDATKELYRKLLQEGKEQI